MHARVYARVRLCSSPIQPLLDDIPGTLGQSEARNAQPLPQTCTRLAPEQDSFEEKEKKTGGDEESKMRGGGDERRRSITSSWRSISLRQFPGLAAVWSGVQGLKSGVWSLDSGSMV